MRQLQGIPYTVHMSLDISGALKNPRALRCFTDEFGSPVKPAVVRDTLRLMQARGARVFRMYPKEECPDFSDQTGCPGHPIESLDSSLL